MTTTMNVERMRTEAVVLPPAADLAALIREGETTDTIAAGYGCSAGTVGKRLQLAGFNTGTGEPNPPTETTWVAGLFDPQPWADQALCAETDPEAFFPDKGGSTRNAKKVCRTCPVRGECLQAALDRDERFGIWGGFSERERRAMKQDPTALAAAFADIAAPATTTPTPAPAPPVSSDSKDPVMPDQTRCRWCRNHTPDLTDDLCTGCLADATTPTPAEPTPATGELGGFPDYIVQIATVMRDAEGHADPAVKAARKTVANALVGLNKALAAATVVAVDVEEGRRNAAALDAELASIEKRGKKTAPATGGKGARPNNSLRNAERVAALGTTTALIRDWARDEGLDVPSRGALPTRLIDAYENAHPQAVAS